VSTKGERKRTKNFIKRELVNLWYRLFKIDKNLNVHSFHRSMWEEILFIGTMVLSFLVLGILYILVPQFLFLYIWSFNIALICDWSSWFIFLACILGSWGVRKMLCHLVDARCYKLKFNFIDLKKLKFRGVDLRLRQISNPFFC